MEQINTYKEFLDFCQEFNLLNNQKRLKGLSKCRGESRTNRLAADKILKKLTSFLPEDSSNQVRMRYVIWNRTPENLKCPVDECNEEIIWSDRNSKFTTTCSCRDQKHLDYIEKVRQQRAKDSQLQKFDGWAAQTPEFKEKRRETTLKKYGKKTYAETKKFKYFMKAHKNKFNKRREKTNLKKYGVTSYSFTKEYQKRIPEFKAKAKSTNLKKYGTLYFQQSPEYIKNIELIKNKIRLTNLKRYGHEHPVGSKKIYQKLIINRNLSVTKKKIEDTNLKKYGYLYATQSPEVKQKLRDKWPETKKKVEDTNLDRYKAKTFMQAHLKNTHLLTKEYLEENFLDKNKNIKMKEMIQFYNMKETACYKYMRDFGIRIKYKDGGFNPDKPAILYYLKDTETGLYKIGITNRKSIEERFGKAFCSKRAIALKEQSFISGQEALEYEQEILEQFAYARCINNSWPQEKGGHTEFFKWDILRLDVIV